MPAMVKHLDDTLIADGHAQFASMLAKDLVVNSPQNGISVSGATGRRNVSGLIRYSRYTRSIEDACKLGDLVILMGDENVVPKGDTSMADKEVRSRAVGDFIISDNALHGICRLRSFI